ncbi:MAG: 4-(cytidine 5'-diphospho)-2-C-methyl-D-erythritol kinase [Muribaculaceae bacterium]|nr:4-(cytidine 5'-diphospho)-2-C-methyl-D-erythritol kinase [Muribaculaceae bacterium]
MILFPNAKINLGLDILRRRPDGYHDIETVMIPVDWCDILEIVPAAGAETTLTVSGRAVECPVEKNLVMKAYRALSAITDVPAADIYLQKIIPDGAGLGGGSADAAFTLRGLNEVFSLGLSDSTLAEIAAGIGADCPFFIHNRPMLCTGTGTDMSPIEIDLSGYTLVIAKPQVSVPTAAAYSRVRPHIPVTPLASRLSQPVDMWKGSVVNEFEPSVFPLYPAVEQLKSLFSTGGAVYTAMSGSGSSVYAIFTSDKLAEEMTAHLEECEIRVIRL